MSTVEDDEEAQKRGVVGCSYGVGGDLQSNNLQRIRKVGKLRKTLPARINSMHLCYNEPLMIPVVSLGMFVMGSHTCMRFRAHYGSHEECQCQLSSFGIPISALPVSPRGEVNFENHRTFMAMQRASEVTKSKRKGPLCVPQTAKKMALSRRPITREDIFVTAPPPNQPNANEPTGYAGGLMGFSNHFLPSFAAIPWWSGARAPSLPQVVVPQHRQLPLVPPTHTSGPTSASRSPAKVCKSPAKPYVISDPLPNDILLGRGKPIQYRPANVRFRKMLDSHIEKFGNGRNGGNVFSPTYIVHLVKEDGGRFLKELEDGGWVEVDEATAQAKVSQAFRTRRQVFQATSLKKDKRTA
jgi:hypothetical protein